ncbi:MAG: tetratricopeptide repeat protein, partial [Gammaproteobacteria bacterium]
MKYTGIGILSLCSVLSACITTGDPNTLASLRNVSIEIKEEKIDDSLDKALQSYQKFLEETPESALTPEAIRRLADLKIEKEYSAFSGNKEASAKPKQDTRKSDSSQPVAEKPVKTHSKSNVIAKVGESVTAFEKRATQKAEFKSTKKAELPAATADDLQTAGAMEAIQLYKNLLIKYPLYERNDQVLYQLSRAYEETGQVEEAVKVLNQLVKEYPNSRHTDEAQFRRAEYFFTRKRYLDSEEAYQAVINIGIGSAFYELALYKQGWAFFKQDLYEEALDDFIALLDYKLSIGYDFEQAEDKIEKKRIDDTYRVISLGFSYLGGAKSVVEYFDKKGQRIYEASIYSHLAEYYLEKRRYADSADTYNTYVERNPMNKVSPFFHIRVIEIYLKGGFPKLVIESKKTFSINYGLRGAYWTFFDINTFPDVLAYLKSNLVDLANHYHAMYQDRRLRKYKADNFKEATHWYREYLASFPEEPQAASMNFQLAELLLQNKDFRGAALEYERTAYDYLSHEKSSDAGYAAVFAYREFLKIASQSERQLVKREVIRSSLRFADSFPKHYKAVVVLV